MSDKYAALKQAAEKATPGEWCTGEHHEVIADAGLNANYYVASCSGPDHRANTKFIAAANPANILALTEALEAAQHESAVNWEAATSLVEENEDLKRRIAELEARTLTVKMPDDGMDDCYDLWGPEQCRNNFDCGYNFSAVRHEEAFREGCAAAGINLKIEGE